MKEMDIVDFTAMKKNEDDEFVDGDTMIGCPICYTHSKAYKNLLEMQKTKDPLYNHPREIVPLCPKCGKMLRPYSDYGYEYGTVSEVNYSNPDGVERCTIFGESFNKRRFIDKYINEDSIK